MKGWISIHRKVLENPIVCKDSDYFSVWVYLLLNATHQEQDKIFKGKKRTLQKGQLITGRKSISQQFNISESKVQRILKRFEIEQQIEQETSTKNRLITILNWEQYQDSEQQNEQQVNNKRTTSEQQVNTNNNVIMKQCNNVNKFIIPTIEEIKAYCEERNNNVNPNNFYDFYQSNGWKVGKNKMKDWKASVRTWERNNKTKKEKINKEIEEWLNE